MSTFEDSRSLPCSPVGQGPGTVAELLAEAARLNAAWDAAFQEVQTAERRYRRTRDRAVLRAWDVSLAALDDISEKRRANSRALREAVGA